MMKKHPRLPARFISAVSKVSPDAADLIERDFLGFNATSNEVDNMSSLNCYLRRSLSSVIGTDFTITSDPRRYLRDGISENEWIMQVEYHIVPLLVNKWYPTIRR